MPLKIIGAGFGRTGTLSIKMALEQVGLGPCHHMEEVSQNSPQLPFLEAAARGETVDWDQIFDGYESAVDWPSAHYWRQLADHYPDAKVILSLRPAENWWRSYSRTNQKVIANKAYIPALHPKACATMGEKIITEQTFNNATDKISPPAVREVAMVVVREVCGHRR